MKLRIQHKRVFFFVVALAVTPLLFGHAFHCLIPCTTGFYRNTDQNTPPTEKVPCAVCQFLATPCDVVPPVVCDGILDLIEHREPEPVRLCVLLYRPFEPGRAPPTVS